jgi:hypothetical protein
MQKIWGNIHHKKYGPNILFKLSEQNQEPVTTTAFVITFPQEAVFHWHIWLKELPLLDHFTPPKYTNWMLSISFEMEKTLLLKSASEVK